MTTKTNITKIMMATECDAGADSDTYKLLYRSSS